MNHRTTAILRDERDLLWIVLDDVRRRGGDLVHDVHFLARTSPSEPPEPFLSTFGHREPTAAFDSLLEDLGHAVAGGVRALRHDPINAGLSLELKSRPEEGGDAMFEVTAWLSLVRMNQAMKARAVRGRHQSGLRMMITRAGLEAFRSELIALTEGPVFDAE